MPPVPETMMFSVILFVITGASAAIKRDATSNAISISTREKANDL